MMIQDIKNHDFQLLRNFIMKNRKMITYDVNSVREPIIFQVQVRKFEKERKRKSFEFEFVEFQV